MLEDGCSCSIRIRHKKLKVRLPWTTDVATTTVITIFLISFIKRLPASWLYWSLRFLHLYLKEFSLHILPLTITVLFAILQFNLRFKKFFFFFIYFTGVFQLSWWPYWVLITIINTILVMLQDYTVVSLLIEVWHV